MTSPFASLAPGDPADIGGYRLVARLGAGGMGQVYLAATRSGRLLAVKVVHTEYAGNAEFRRRFQQEVAAVQRVHSLYTAPVIDADTGAQRPWLATAYVPGPSLDKAVAAHGPLPAGTALTLACGAAEALQAIHAAGVIHRDLKPSNVLLAADGPRVIDFGIAKAVDATPLTGTGVRVGTPVFMAPEQALGHLTTPAADVFALGGLLCFAVTGRTPFGEGPDAGVLYRVVHDEPQLDGVPAELRDLIAHCLAKDPAHRPTPRDLVTRLQPYARTPGLAPTRPDGHPSGTWPIGASGPGETAAPSNPSGHGGPGGAAHPPAPGAWLPPGVGQALPAYSSPPSPPPLREPRRVRLKALLVTTATAVAVTAVAAATATAMLMQSPAGGGGQGAAPGPTVTVTQTQPAAQAVTPPATAPPSGQTPSGETSSGETPSTTDGDGSAVGTKPSGTQLGSYKGIDLTRSYSVSFTDDPMHPKQGDEQDLTYCSLGLCAESMALLDPGQPGTHRACVDNTRYTDSIEVGTAKGRLVCVFTQSTIGLVKVTGSAEDPARYLTLDLTVWQR
ncbi:serine/threonine-protein kinase [Nonomuraea typhae]|uniref:serine/threonine-protein kinase n=1 Tax=Nonomuraea typhae TaxID=2603600 RepID=UPI001FEA69D5|nr:serine/threonine-protein kinase [Nonomuraea typhae]